MSDVETCDVTGVDTAWCDHCAYKFYKESRAAAEEWIAEADSVNYKETVAAALLAAAEVLNSEYVKRAFVPKALLIEIDRETLRYAPDVKISRTQMVSIAIREWIAMQAAQRATAAKSLLLGMAKRKRPLPSVMCTGLSRHLFVLDA